MRTGGIIALVVAALGVISCGGAGSAQSAEVPVIRAVQVGTHENATRFVADVSERVDVNLATVARPSRIVVNLPNLRFMPSACRTGAGGLVQRVRCEPPQHGLGAQIALDTTAPALVSNMFFEAKPGRNAGYKLIIDLVAASPPTQVAAQRPTPAATPVQREASAVQPVQRGAPEGFLRLKTPPPPAPDPTPSAPVRRAAQPSPKPVASDAPPDIQPVLVASVAPSAQAARPRATPPPPVQTRGRRPIIMIDPGHGGADPGAIGRQGDYEKTVVLAVARALKAELDKTGKFEVVMTRNSDIFIPLGERVAIARRAGADLFMSIHADTIADSSVRGAGVYTLSAEASDSVAAALAAKENSSDEIAGIDLSDQPQEVSSILIDFAQHHTQERSVRLAELVVPEITQAIGVRQHSHRSAGFRVLKAPDMPSVLVELGYLSNPIDERTLLSRDGQTKLASALRRGIENYFRPAR